MSKKLKFYFLGGVGEIGKNMTAIEYGENIIIVDSGSSFPTSETPGVDLIIPNFNFVEKNKDNIRAVILTHGHEDHIGAVPYLLKIVPQAKIYGSKLTLTLLTHKLTEHKMVLPKMVIAKNGEDLKVACFSVEFIKTSHSISGAYALAITTPVGKILHTGDYKIDLTPIDNEMIDLTRIGELGKNGLILMLGESTNIEKEGFSMSERKVGDTFEKIFAKYNNNRIIIATFASNVHRVQQILDLCVSTNRKVVFNGRSMLNISKMAEEIGELKVPADLVIEPEQMSNYPNKRICIISTGSQGEPMSALTRMAQGSDKVNITRGDVVIMSSSPIPGNERHIYNVINNLYKLGAEVLYGSLNELHVSGHACKEELKIMLGLARPKFFIPIHGEYRHLVQHRELAIEMGMFSENVRIAEIGSVFEINKNGIFQQAKVEAGNTYVDGFDDVDSVILRDRTHLSKDGVICIMIVVQVETGELAEMPSLTTVGVNITDDMLTEMKEIVLRAIDKFPYKNGNDKRSLELKIRTQVSRFLLNKIRQRPFILPNIMDI